MFCGIVHSQFPAKMQVYVCLLAIREDPLMIITPAYVRDVPSDRTYRRILPVGMLIAFIAIILLPGLVG